MKNLRIPLFLAFASLALMSQAQTTIKVQGQKQGWFLGMNQPKTKVTVLSFEQRVSIPTSGSGMSSGKRQQGPLMVTLRPGQCLPQFLQAAYTNENLTQVKIDHYGPNMNGDSVLGLSVVLQNASILSVKTYRKDDSKEILIDVVFNFQKITYETEGGLTAQDDWKGPTAMISETGPMPILRPIGKP